MATKSAKAKGGPEEVGGREREVLWPEPEPILQRGLLRKPLPPSVPEPPPPPPKLRK
jgi:hypothetical protein